MTDNLRLLVLLDEVERQSSIFSDALSAAIDRAVTDENSNSVWRHLQGALFAAAVVNRLLTTDGPNPYAWPNVTSKAEGSRKSRAAKENRVSELKALLNLPDDETQTLIYGMRTVRNFLEHADERLDFALYSGGVNSISDWYVSDGTVFVSTDEKLGLGRTGLRAFCPEAGMLLFDYESLDLFGLDLDMHRLRHNAREAKAELLATIKGRCTFGDGKLAQIPPHLTDRIDRWRVERARLLDELPPAGAAGATIKMWMAIDET